MLRVLGALLYIVHLLRLRGTAMALLDRQGGHRDVEPLQLLLVAFGDVKAARAKGLGIACERLSGSEGGLAGQDRGI